MDFRKVTPDSINNPYSFQCPLTIAPDFSMYTFSNGTKILAIDLEAYQMNASLAIQLAHAWMQVKKSEQHNGLINGSKIYKSVNSKCDIVTAIPYKTVQGLKECRWPGRFQVIRKEGIDYYLDGAHTKESMEICAKWFEENNRDREKILIFSATGDRDVEVLLKPLRSIRYKKIFFVIPTAYVDVNKNQDNYSSVEQKDLIAKCHNNANIWKNNQDSNEDTVLVLECVADALQNINSETGVSILITGSLHLVGATLSIIYPKLY